MELKLKHKQGLFLKLINFMKVNLSTFKNPFSIKLVSKEQGSFAFRMNIFRNAVSKFGIFVDLKKSTSIQNKS